MQERGLGPSSVGQTRGRAGATGGLAAETPVQLNTGRIVEYCPEVESTCVSWSLMGSDGPVAPVGWW